MMSKWATVGGGGSHQAEKLFQLFDNDDIQDIKYMIYWSAVDPDHIF